MKGTDRLQDPLNGFALERIGQVAVRARDLEASVDFYRDALGLPLLFRAPPGLAFLKCGDLHLMLSAPESPEFDHPSSVLYFEVDDIETAYRVLGERGVVFLGEPHRVHRAEDHELWMAFFRDPDGNVLAIRARRPPA
ncbi:MAG TPA: VOC family protein [Gemmatimonadota bacterium]|nr:VOC family protein [Gemmatimonadota bacterium]